MLNWPTFVGFYNINSELTKGWHILFVFLSLLFCSYVKSTSALMLAER